jgi:hypothetical protein
MLPDPTRDTEWTPGIGLQRAAMSLLIKSPICLVVWMICLWGIDLLITWLVTNTPIRAAVVIIAFLAVLVAIPALPVGHLVSNRLIDRAGFAGPIPAGLAVVTVCVTVLLGTWLMTMLIGPATWITTLATLAMGIEASVVVLWRTWVDPD